ncbi:30S ribosomal protein S12 chloroplastic [Dissostichus eleginoides]|uniref:30S ribosomal protein S12 chloroplastic n=1 Tax=Dissostichus eleginoides TaxID=100907 RepID=A0AAD9F8D1_DISEL|nr:30S ribosomal protein S12 chloroplastic [Dissostichus eleginoides]
MAGIVHIFHAGRRGYCQRVHTERPNLSNSTQQKNFRIVFDLDLMTSTTLLIWSGHNCSAEPCGVML